jgi:hypothetical protein
MNIPRQLAAWTQGEVINDVAIQRYGKQSKKSERRQRTQRVTVRLLPAERAALIAAAEQACMSISTFIRTSSLQATQRNEESN